MTDVTTPMPATGPTRSTPDPAAMFAPFTPGTVHHPLATPPGPVRPPADEVRVRYPTRLNAMALQPGAIAGDNNLIYDAGEVVFSVARHHHVHVRRRDPGAGLVLDPRVRRPELAEHAALIMCAALGVEPDLAIGVESDPLPVHAGFGSSSSLIAAVAAAVNHLYGCPVDRADLLPYLTGNHGEEHGSRPGLLTPVQCIGGSAASGLYPGGVQVVAGRGTVVLSVPVPEHLSLVIGVPRSLEERPTDELMAAEVAHFDRFRATGERWSPTIAFRMLHEAMPAALRATSARSAPWSSTTGSGWAASRTAPSRTPAWPSWPAKWSPCGTRRRRRCSPSPPSAPPSSPSPTTPAAAPSASPSWTWT